MFEGPTLNFPYLVGKDNPPPPIPIPLLRAASCHNNAPAEGAGNLFKVSAAVAAWDI